MNIVLVAQEAAGVQALRLLGKAQDGNEHHVTAVLTGTDRGEGAERGVTVAATARELGVPVLPARRVKDPDFAADLRQQQVDVLLNVHSLYLIDADVLAAPRIGSFNLHPGPLPQYAGLNVPSWAIYHGEVSHGVTLHWMAPQVDAGPIAFSASFPLTSADTGLSVSAQCVRHGIPLIAELLDGLSGGAIPAVAQDLTRRRYFGRAVPHDGWVPWNLSAKQVTDFVRACDYGPWPSPWGRPRTRMNGIEITITRAGPTGVRTTETPGTVGAPDGDGIRVAAADEWVLVSRMRIGGTSASPAEALRSGDRLVAVR